MRSLTFLLILFIAASCGSGSAEPAPEAEIFQTGGKAIHGYDPVAFFRQQQAVAGKDSFQTRWKEADWYFSSRENLDSFIARPDAYAPQYGGYCAYGMSENHKAPTEIDTWTLHEGKLYFNYNRDVQKLWTPEKESRIQAADSFWASTPHLSSK